jgi:small-conductance mechanosensitive channel
MIHTLGARYVSVVGRDGREFLIPNEDLITNQVLNWTYSSELVRLDLSFGTSADDDPRLVRRIAVETASQHPRVIANRTPVCHIVEFGDFAIKYVLRFWIGDPSQGVTNVRGDIFLALWEAFRAAGIRVPNPQYDVVIRQPRGIEKKGLKEALAAPAS